MNIQTHSDGEKNSTAIYSDCGAYRYALTRIWAAQSGLVNFVMLNPSVADAKRNDPTVERCERRARHLGFGGFSVTNLFAWRDTDPFRMRQAEYPIGPDNSRLLLEHATMADKVVIAWGVHGAHRDRGPAVLRLFAEKGIVLHHLGLTKEGHPRHPLYVSYKQPLLGWKPNSG